MKLINVLSRLLVLWSLCSLAAEAGDLRIKADVGKRRTVIAEGEFGFRFFPDQPVSIISKNPLLYTLVVGDKTWLMRGNSFEDSVPVRLVLDKSNVKGSYDEKYSGINSVFVDPKNHKILAFSHNERHTGGVDKQNKVNRFYSTIALAVSTGRTIQFRKVGPIITGLPCDYKQDRTAQGAAEPSVCLDRSKIWLYLYYTSHDQIDRSTGKPRGVITCVARSLVKDEGRPGSWHKYYKGMFAEPGLGGKDTEVADCWAASVVYVPSLDKYIMVGSKNEICFFTSHDGLRWTKGGTLVRANDIPVINENVAWHPRFLISRMTHDSVTGQLVYSYGPKFIWPTVDNYGQSYHFVKRQVKFSLVSQGDKKATTNSTTNR